MTTSIDPSVDELLLLQENRYHMPNSLLTTVKPIGAERKTGQLTNASAQLLSQTRSPLVPPKRVVYPKDRQENNCQNSVESTPSISIHSSNYDYVHKPFIHQTNNDLHLFTYHPSHNHSSQSSSDLLDNYNYQQQASSFIQQKLHQSISTRSQTAQTIPSIRVPRAHATSRFFTPNSSQLNSRHGFINISQQIRTIPPVFTPPFQCTRERFQVNSIGRPILRTNNYNYLSHVHGFKARR